MAIDPQIKATLNQTIYVGARSSVSSSGDPTFSAAASRDARVEFNPTRIVGADGEEIVSEAQIICEAEIGTTDRVWLPGDSQADSTLARMPKAVHQCIGESGSTDYYVVYL